MTATSAPERITLYYKEGSSDKVYQAAVEPEGDGFIVRFAYGRRGSTMNTGTKTAKPVDQATAKKIYHRLVAEKTAKGYTPGAEGTPYQDTERESRSTGVVPQLLNPIDEPEALRLIADRGWVAQEKLDGKRILIRRSDQQIIGINRSGLVIALPQPVVAQALTLGGQQWLIDGEAIGEVFWAFDLLEGACINLRTQPYERRLKALYAMVTIGGTQPIRAIETARTSAEKRALLARLRQDHREGIVFKRHEAPHTPGRPASGGDQVKLKFTATASCIVAGVNGAKRSVALELVDGDKRIAVGNVTIPVNQPIPARGAVLEVKYLYAYPGGALFQPVCLGVRDDIAADACTIAQLKYKAADSDPES